MFPITEGILFENSQTFIPWGNSLDSSQLAVDTSIREHADRYVYEWGEQVILSGLRLNLISIQYKFNSDALNNELHKIESWAIGDLEAETEWSRITNHLLETLGEPEESKTESSPPEKMMLWRIENVDIMVYFFEQHCFKNVISIEKI